MAEPFTAEELDALDAGHESTERRRIAQLEEQCGSLRASLEHADRERDANRDVYNEAVKRADEAEDRLAALLSDVRAWANDLKSQEQAEELHAILDEYEAP